MEADELRKILAGNDSFLGVPEAAVSALVAAGEIVSLATESLLLEQGRTGQSIWVLVEGNLEVLVDGDIVNRVSAPGELIGEISAVSMTPATATVRADGPVVALRVTPKSLHAIMEKSADLAKSMVKSMTKYLGRR